MRAQKSQSIKRKAAGLGIDWKATNKIEALHPKEKELIKLLAQFPDTIQLAAANFSPAVIANYIYDLVKGFNSFYQQVPILADDNEQLKMHRVQISHKVGEVIAFGFKLLGIEVPERM